MDELSVKKIQAIVILKDANAIKDVVEYFNGAGFDTAEIVGGSIIIFADKSLFEEVFRTNLVQNLTSVCVAEAVEGSATNNLPLNNLDPSIRCYIRAIEFEEIIDFGPTSY